MEGAWCIGVQDSTHTAEARRMAIQLAAGLAFDETERGNVGLVVTEAARNLLKHAAGELKRICAEIGLGDIWTVPPGTA